MWSTWYFVLGSLVGASLASHHCDNPEAAVMPDDVFATRMRPLVVKGVENLLERLKEGRAAKEQFTEADLEEHDRRWNGLKLDEMPHMKAFLKKAAPLRVRLIKTLIQDVVDHDELKKIAAESAKIYREDLTPEVKNDFLHGKMLMTPEAIQTVKDVIGDTAALTAELSDKTGLQGYPLSNSTFVKELSKKGNTKIYALAGYFRCLLDSWDEFMPKRDERIGTSPSCDYLCVERKRNQLRDHCSGWKEGVVTEALVGVETFVTDLLHIFKTEAGLYALFEDMAIYMDALKKLPTFATAAEFADSLASKNERYSAVVTIVREVLKCKYNSLGLQDRHPFPEAANAGLSLLKRLFETPTPTAEDVTPQAIEFITKYITVKNLLHLPCMGNWTLRLSDSVEECLLPADASEFADSKLGDLKNTPESKAAFLEAIKPKSASQHAVYKLLLHYMDNIMKREQLTQPVKDLAWDLMIFFTAVSRNIPEYKARVFEHIATFRTRFLALSPADRLLLVDNFPLGSTQMLAIAF